MGFVFGIKQWLAGCLDMFFPTLRKNEKIRTREYAENWPAIPGTSEEETSQTTSNAPWKGARQPSRRQDLKTAGFLGS